MKVDYVWFKTRDARSRYIADTFRPYLSGSLLDVGCDKALLKNLLGCEEYTGVDMGGTPDITLNLEEADGLPFDDASFDSVVCSDVLEHLDNLHAMFLELVRVTRKYLIISLPNCWGGARRPIARGKGGFGHYGLPFDKPVDRHKWFFSLSEGEAFLIEQAKRCSLNVVDIRTTEKPRPGLLRAIRRLGNMQQMNYLNRYAHTLWIVLEK